MGGGLGGFLGRTIAAAATIIFLWTRRIIQRKSNPAVALMPCHLSHPTAAGYSAKDRQRW